MAFETKSESQNKVLPQWHTVDLIWTQAPWLISSASLDEWFINLEIRFRKKTNWSDHTTHKTLTLCLQISKLSFSKLIWLLSPLFFSPAFLFLTSSHRELSIPRVFGQKSSKSKKLISLWISIAQASLSSHSYLINVSFLHSSVSTGFFPFRRFLLTFERLWVPLFSINVKAFTQSVSFRYFGIPLHYFFIKPKTKDSFKRRLQKI